MLIYLCRKIYNHPSLSIKSCNVAQAKIRERCLVVCLAEFCALAPSTMKLHVCDVHLTETYSRPIYLELLLV